MKNKEKVCGIVVEYNPFHNGHKHHIEEAVKITNADVLIAAMSPNFVQRGEPAIVNKWERTKAALDNGVDIVVEIPSPFVLQRADIFAESAIKLLSYMKADSIVYGSESNQKQSISPFDKESIKKGESFAKAANTQNLSPNDLLGSLYEKYAKKYNMKTHTIQRSNEYHSLSLDNEIVSASAIRKHLHEKGNVSNFTSMNLEELTIHKIDDYEESIQLILAREDKEELRNILLMDEGIENLFLKQSHKSIHDLINDSSSKRYTKSRIQRTLMNMLLKHNKNEIKFPSHARILGMSENGLRYLSQYKEELSYCTSFKNYELKDVEMKASQIYSLVYSQEYYEYTILREKNKPLIKK